MALIPCPNCGHIISDKASNCPKCGKSINISIKPTTLGNNSNNNGSKIAILVSIIVILSIVLIVVLAIVFINRNKQYVEDYYNYDNSIEEVVDESVALYDDYQDDNDNFVSLSELEAYISEYNEELPEYIDEGMDLEMVYLDGNYVVYSYSLDEDYYDIDDFRTNRSDVKRSLKSELLNNTDEDVRIFINSCKSNNKGIAYRFVGMLSGDACTIYINSNEL